MYFVTIFYVTITPGEGGVSPNLINVSNFAVFLLNPSLTIILKDFLNPRYPTDFTGKPFVIKDQKHGNNYNIVPTITKIPPPLFMEDRY